MCTLYLPDGSRPHTIWRTSDAQSLRRHIEVCNFGGFCVFISCCEGKCTKTNLTNAFSQLLAWRVKVCVCRYGNLGGNACAPCKISCFNERCCCSGSLTVNLCVLVSATCALASLEGWEWLRAATSAPTASLYSNRYGRHSPGRPRVPVAAKGLCRTRSSDKGVSPPGLSSRQILSAGSLRVLARFVFTSDPLCGEFACSRPVCLHVRSSLRRVCVFSPGLSSRQILSAESLRVLARFVFTSDPLCGEFACSRPVCLHVRSSLRRVCVFSPGLSSRQILSAESLRVLARFVFTSDPLCGEFACSRPVCLHVRSSLRRVCVFSPGLSSRQILSAESLRVLARFVFTSDPLCGEFTPGSSHTLETCVSG